MPSWLFSVRLGKRFAPSILICLELPLKIFWLFESSFHAYNLPFATKLKIGRIMQVHGILVTFVVLCRKVY